MKNINKLPIGPCLFAFFFIYGCRVCSQTSGHTESEYDEAKPYDFSYFVKDNIGNDFGHNAMSDGDVVKGWYRTLLPDGRIQTVSYQADWKNGYKAQVTYSAIPTDGNIPQFGGGAAGGAALGKQPCDEGNVGDNCNPASGVDDTVPSGDF